MTIMYTERAVPLTTRPFAHPIIAPTATPDTSCALFVPVPSGTLRCEGWWLGFLRWGEAHNKGANF